MITSNALGSGILFPIELDVDGRPAYVNDIRIINASIIQILNTPQNTRFFNENFGSRINELLDEPNDSIANNLLRTFIKEAIDKFEKRVKLISLTISNYDSYKVNIQLVYEVINTKTEETLIFPYYKDLP